MVGCIIDIALTVFTLGLWIPIRLFFRSKNKSSAVKPDHEVGGEENFKDITHREQRFLKLNIKEQQLIMETKGNDIIWQSFTPEIRERYGETNRLYACTSVRQILDAKFAADISPRRCFKAVGMFLEVETDRRKKENRRNGDMVEEVVMNYWFYKLGVSNIIESRDDEMLWGVKWLLHPDMRIAPNTPCKVCKSLDGKVWPKDDTSILLPVLDTHLGCNCFLDTISSFQAAELGLSDQK